MNEGTFFTLSNEMKGVDAFYGETKGHPVEPNKTPLKIPITMGRPVHIWLKPKPNKKMPERACLKFDFPDELGPGSDRNYIAVISRNFGLPPQEKTETVIWTITACQVGKTKPTAEEKSVPRPVTNVTITEPDR